MSYAISVRVVKLGGKDCKYDGGKICNGAVTKEIGTKLVKICSDGRIKTKTRKSVGEGFPLVGRDTGEGKGEDLPDRKVFNLKFMFESSNPPVFKCFHVWDQHPILQIPLSKIFLKRMYDR